MDLLTIFFWGAAVFYAVVLAIYFTVDLKYPQPFSRPAERAVITARAFGVGLAASAVVVAAINGIGGTLGWALFGLIWGGSIGAWVWIAYQYTPFGAWLDRTVPTEAAPR